MMQLSYWEIKSWLSNIDFCIVGSGIVGLSCALKLRELYPKAKIIILEKGILPQGASTKNAGFACFGSLSEILEDLKSHTEEEVFQLVKKRAEGLKLLRQTLGDKQLNFQQLGGYELFLEKNKALFKTCIARKSVVNKLLKPIFKDDVFSLKDNIFKFKNIESDYIFNQFEGQIDTGAMMDALLKLVQSKGIKILNAVLVEDIIEANNSIRIKTNHFEFSASKLYIATNGFASQLLKEDVKPARAQIVITKPIADLNVKGTFHLDKGYFYFRNVNNRILLGGGRHLDFKGETTTQLGETATIQNALEKLLSTTILPNYTYEIEHRWSGIMGVGNQKQAIVKQVSSNVFCGVRLGGMGVAVGSLIGKELAELTL
ncbi:glycine/D-amino acid oxidase-like deaminating enzyme [Jejuia pallidilutea]|uniref:Glycine/D-amino acid oxidase-like deaminating enzyme n=2 Tax=Jejuia pallidilutea TaxID=504487 RepID=A0A362X4K2_9FLAO|nr:glycine/D-amino acid oxidase-like deaminating enzyme [Jejuia pallidilutea]